jgi:hypothetical protein
MTAMAAGATSKPFESPFDWVQRSLAGALGVAPRDIPLRRDQTLEMASDAEIARLTRILEARYVALADPRTGAISFVTRGPAFAIESAEARNRDMADRATLALTPLPAKLRELDLSLAPWRLAEPEVAAVLDAAVAAIETLRTELRGDASAPVVDGLFAELLGPTGWLALLRGPFDGSEPPTAPTSDVERQLEIVEIVSDAIECLHHAWESDQEEADGLGELLDFVTRCAGHIGDQTRLVREVLAEQGVGRCEMQAVGIALDERRKRRGDPEPPPYAEARDRISFDDLLRQAEDFAARAPGVADRGATHALGWLRSGSALLRRRLDRVDAKEIVAQKFKIAESAQGETMAAIVRLSAIVAGFDARLQVRSNAEPRGKAGDPDTVSPPDEDKKPMK